MQIIVAPENGTPERVKATDLGRETVMSEFVLDNPMALGRDTIRDDLRFQVLAHEFPTAHGPIDMLGMDDRGVPYVLEVKLHRNTSRREVIAQIMEYAAGLTSRFSGRAEFTEEVRDAVSSTLSQPLDAVLSDFPDEVGELSRCWCYALIGRTQPVPREQP